MLPYADRSPNRPLALARHAGDRGRLGAAGLCHPDPPGLKELQCCRKTGFHPEHTRNGKDAGNGARHPASPQLLSFDPPHERSSGVYDHTSHVVWDAGRELKVVDVRKDKAPGFV